MVIRALTFALCAVLVYIFATAPIPLGAQEAGGPVGELVLPLDGQTVFSRFFAPSSGALFALAPAAKAGEQARLIRSDDGGTTWRDIVLPPPPPAESGRPMTAIVDPVDHTILYAIGAEGLYKSEDDAASWRPILPLDQPNVLVAVSPADHQLVYVRLAGETSVRLLRSADGGGSWETASTGATSAVGSSGAVGCAATTVLVPHPSDPDRLVGNVGCESETRWDLFLSRDRGASWSPLLKQRGQDTGSPAAFVGGRGARPERLYAGFESNNLRDVWLHLDLPIYRSDDDGQTWSTAIIVPFAVSGPKSQERNRNYLAALEYDPTDPDRVYVGLLTDPSRGVGALQASADGGKSWRALDVGGAQKVHALVLGIDGRNLYAASERGIYRLRLR